MKDYTEVVQERFDNETDQSNENSIYSENHPIGKYSRQVIFKRIDTFIELCAAKNIDIKTARLLDVGCGNGGMLAYFESKGFKPENLFGVDLSSKRIEFARKKHPDFQLSCQNALSFELDQTKFDVIVSFDLFSHLRAKTEIVTGLNQINKYLEKDGVFMWYDIYSKDHFNPKPNADSWGFSEKQMVELSSECGLKKTASYPLFKLFLGKYHSLYQAKRFSPKMLTFLEKMIPGSPGNIMMIFEKI